MTCDVGVRGASGGVEIRDGMDLAWTHTPVLSSAVVLDMLLACLEDVECHARR